VTLLRQWGVKKGTRSWRTQRRRNGLGIWTRHPHLGRGISSSNKCWTNWMTPYEVLGRLRARRRSRALCPRSRRGHVRSAGTSPQTSVSSAKSVGMSTTSSKRARLFCVKKGEADTYTFIRTKAFRVNTLFRSVPVTIFQRITKPAQRGSCRDAQPPRLRLFAVIANARPSGRTIPKRHKHRCALECREPSFGA
jgi:hypothetical protein